MWRVGFGLVGLVGKTGFGAWGLNMLQEVSAREIQGQQTGLGLGLVLHVYGSQVVWILETATQSDLGIGARITPPRTCEHAVQRDPHDMDEAPEVK